MLSRIGFASDGDGGTCAAEVRQALETLFYTYTKLKPSSAALSSKKFETERGPYIGKKEAILDEEAEGILRTIAVLVIETSSAPPRFHL